MKKIGFIVLLMFSVVLVNAQNPLAKGQAQFNAGLGFSNWGLPVYAGIDFGVHKDISVGGELSVHSFSEKYGPERYHHTIFGISANGNYHFNSLMQIPSTWDFYAGLSIGFNIWNSPGDYPGSYTSGLGLGAQIGGRYFFTNRFGLNLELAAGNAATGGKFGITLKFR